MKRYLAIPGIVGLAAAVYGVASAVLYSSPLWYTYFIIGGTAFLGWVNHKIDNRSVFSKNMRYVLETYGIYLVVSILIEIGGRLILGLWRYPAFGPLEEAIFVFLIGYPFAFALIHESFKLVRKLPVSYGSAVVLTTVINALAHEIPNLYASRWVYDIPYVQFAVFGINIVVLVGWVILVAVPLVTERVLEEI